MEVSTNSGIQHRPQFIMMFILGTPQRVHLILLNYPPILGAILVVILEAPAWLSKVWSYST